MEAREQEAVMEYAGFWIRLGAYILDGIILGVFSFVLGLILGFGLLSWQGAPLDEIPATYYLADVILGLVYYVGFWTWRGQTPGKMLLRLRIIRTDGAHIALDRAILRYAMFFIVSVVSVIQGNLVLRGGFYVAYLGPLLSIINLLIIVGLVWVAFDRRKQGVHDKIADTYVVKLSPKK